MAADQSIPWECPKCGQSGLCDVTVSQTEVDSEDTWQDRISVSAERSHRAVSPTCWTDKLRLKLPFVFKVDSPRQYGVLHGFTE